MRYEEEKVIPDDVFISEGDLVLRVMRRRPILGNEVLEMNASNLANAQLTVVVHDDL